MSTEQQQPAAETLLAEQPQESRGISLSRPRPRLGQDFLERFGLPIILVGVVILFSILRPDTFATAANWRGIAVSQSVLMIAALALIIPLIGARFDVSVGANLGLCGIAAAALMSKTSLPLAAVVVLTIACGTTVGVINGLIVTYLGVSSLITTIGTGTIIGGIVTGYTKGIPISTGISPKLLNLGVDDILGVPALFITALVVAGITGYVITQTPFGRYLTALGSNPNASRLTGLPVERLVVLSFVGAGALCGVGGLMQVAAEGDGNPQIGGIPFILPALAAVFLGATTIRPGRYNVLGTLIALFFIGVTISGLALVGTSPWVTDVFNGVALVFAVAASAHFRRRRTGTRVLGE
jgi:ribose transport system permease protein